MRLRNLDIFKNFTLKKENINGIRINYRIGGKGPPVLLLHGYPQTHIMWRKIAPRLAKNFTVICSDLRGYGDSDKPRSNKRNHAVYSKKSMASDQMNLMQILGFTKYYIIGHDRGARVAHRMGIDNKNIIKIILLDIIPTNIVFKKTDQMLAKAYYHWFFLSQKYPLPERLIEANPEFFLRTKLKMWGNTKNFIEEEIMKEYIRCFSNKEMIHASCEDYRAAASIDISDHNKDFKKKILCPLLILWGRKGTVEKLYNPLKEWKEFANKLEGYSINCGHFIPEEKPNKLLEAINKFF